MMMDAAEAAVDLDLAELYRALASHLARIVKLDTQAPDLVVEDACQHAWDRFIGHGSALPRACALSWLATTAVREAHRLAHCYARELPMHDALEATGATSTSDDVLERREQLTLIRGLPERQQRLLWLQGLGLNYDEMAVYTGCTRRTVERQLLRARRRLRAMAADTAV